MYAGFTFLIYLLYCYSQFFYIQLKPWLIYLALKVCGFLQFDSPYFLINNILRSPGLFNLLLISQMF